MRTFTGFSSFYLWETTRKIEKKKRLQCTDSIQSKNLSLVVFAIGARYPVGNPFADAGEKNSVNEKIEKKDEKKK